MEKKKIIEIEMNSMHELNSAYANAIIQFKEYLKKYSNYNEYQNRDSEIKLLKIKCYDNYREEGYTAIFEIIFETELFDIELF